MPDAPSRRRLLGTPPPPPQSLRTVLSLGKPAPSFPYDPSKPRRILTPEQEAQINAADPLMRLADFVRGLTVGATDEKDTNAAQVGELIQTGLPLLKGAGLGLAAMQGGLKILKGAETAEEAAQAAKRTIRAYHGSPHDFEKFDLSKIGTGEGAQAYGHGLYFAENPGVAEDYRRTLAAPTAESPAFRLRGEPVAVGTDNWRIAQLLDTPKQGETVPDMVARRIKELDDQATFAARAYGDDSATMYRLQAKELRAINPEELTYHRPGKTYEVDINADPEHFLDWDKPVSQQSPQVREALAKYGVQAPDPALIHEAEAQLADYWKEYEAAVRKGDKGLIDIFERSIRQSEHDLRRLQRADERLGSHAYREVGPQSDVVASERLREAGVPGIRYADQGSRNVQIMAPHETTSGQWVVKQVPNGNVLYRGASEEEARKAYAGRTSNYSVFDDALIEIRRKYGWLLPMMGLGALTQVGQPTERR